VAIDLDVVVADRRLNLGFQDALRPHCRDNPYYPTWLLPSARNAYSSNFFSRVCDLHVKGKVSGMLDFQLSEYYQEWFSAFSALWTSSN